MDGAKRIKIEKALRRAALRVEAGGRMVFVPGPMREPNGSREDWVCAVKDRLKVFGRLYYFLLNVFKPTLASREFKRLMGEIVSDHGESSFIINIGAGPNRFQGREDIVNVDMTAFRETDLVADATDIPLVDGCADLVISISMLEHVPAPEAVVAEMYRILKPGGLALCYVPFIQPFHAAPSDFTRWTSRGARGLFEAFEVERHGVGAGPTSGLLWILQEWLALLCSCGVPRLRPLFLLPIMAITAPLKFFDLVLAGLPGAEVLASGVYVLAKKPGFPHEKGNRT